MLDRLPCLISVTRFFFSSFPSLAVLLTTAAGHEYYRAWMIEMVDVKAEHLNRSCLFALIERVFVA